MKKHREPVGPLFGIVVLPVVALQPGVCRVEARWHIWPLETQETVKDCTPQRVASTHKSKPSLFKRHNVTMTEVSMLFVLFGV